MTQIALEPKDAKVKSTESAISELREEQGRHWCKQQLWSVRKLVRDAHKVLWETPSPFSGIKKDSKMSQYLS